MLAGPIAPNPEKSCYRADPVCAGSSCLGVPLTSGHLFLEMHLGSSESGVKGCTFLTFLIFWAGPNSDYRLLHDSNCYSVDQEDGGHSE